MLPIATVQNIRDGISTGMIIDLSQYLKKTEGVSKDELETLENVVANKLDIEPQHKHHIEDIKQLQDSLNSKLDTSQKYSFNTILSDTEKIPYLEAPKMKMLTINPSYQFYVDDASNDLMITHDDILIGTYAQATNHWSFGGVDMRNLVSKNLLDEKTLIEKVNIVDPSQFQFEFSYNCGDFMINSNYSLLNTTVETTITVSGSKLTKVITIGATENDIGVDNNSLVNSISYNDSIKQLKISFGVLINTEETYDGTAKVIENRNISSVEMIDIKTKITELEAVLKNHYETLLILCEKAGIIDPQ